MIREMRNKHKLEQYYRKFVESGELDPNVHPWVAASWQRSRAFGVPNITLPLHVRLSPQELAERQERHRLAIEYVEGLYRNIRDFFHSYNLSLLLLDSECYALRSYAMPFFQKTPGEIAGARVTEADIGTSSISIAAEHAVPFLLFGPEMWVAEGQQGDACSAPVMVAGELRYVLTMVSVDQETLPYSAVMSLMLSMKYALENYLILAGQLQAREAILDAAPFAAYHLLPNDKVAYANRLGKSRLPEKSTEKPVNFHDVLLNYQHTPIYKGVNGVGCTNREVIWITAEKAYEDITTVVPLERNGVNQAGGAVVVSLPVDDLRTLIAHAVSYSARYSFEGLVGAEPIFVAMKDKAMRMARGVHHVLLQGEAGTGKERLAHAIHQASGRVAGPLIVVKCADIPAEFMDGEIFGMLDIQGEHRTGKIELAHGGTLFLDEVERLTIQTADRLAAFLTKRESDKPSRAEVRVIAACDSDLKRLSEKGLFSVALYEVFAKNTIRIPALRQRRNDITLLTEHIIEEQAEQNRSGLKQLSPEAIAALLEYDWPGNIKQLQGIVEQAYFKAEGEWIETQHLRPLDEPNPGNAWKDNRAVFIKAWKSAGGNISRLAQHLDVSRVTLYRYLKKYGLSDN